MTDPSVKGLRRTMTRLLHCLLVTVWIQWLCFSNASAFRGSRLGKVSINRKFNSVAKIDELRKKIIHGLNMTVPPRLKASVVSAEGVATPQTREGPTGETLLAEAPGNKRADSMSFKIHSRLGQHISEVDKAYLVLQLKSTLMTLKRSRSGSRRRGWRGKRRRGRKMTGDEKLKMTGEGPVQKGVQNSKETNAEDKDGNANGRRRLRNLKAWKVKVVVRTVDPVTGRRKRIAVKKVSVKRTISLVVPIPKEVLASAASSPDHTLTLQVLCKRCRRRVLVDQVFKSRRGKRKRKGKKPRAERKLNPNRPYLVIKKVPQREEEHPRRRSRRDLENFCPDNDRSSPSAVQDRLDQTLNCCAQRTYVSFEELGLGDWIIYPHGFNTVYCMGGCTQQREIIPWSVWGTSSRNDPPSSDELTDNPSNNPSENSSDELSNNSADNFPDQLSEDLGEEVGLAREASVGQCIPLQKSALDVVYFTENNRLVTGRLFSLIDGNCGCSL